MSWVINIIGTAEEVVAALDKHSLNISGQSKIEYDDALPSLKALVLQNFGFNRIIEISAGGSGYAENGEQKNRRLYCTIR